MNTTRYQELACAIGQWADRNFDVHDPALGVLEEVGEMAHCLLKRKQGIRGFDQAEHFLKELADGIADTAIYCLHDVFLQSIELDPEGVPLICCIGVEQADQSRHFLGYLGQLAGLLVFGETRSPGGDPLHIDILIHLQQFAAEFGIDFDAKLEETWARVSKRDWRANPTNAAQVAEEVLGILKPDVVSIPHLHVFEYRGGGDFEHCTICGLQRDRGSL